MSDPAYKQKNYGQALTNAFKKIDEKLRSPKGEEELKKIH